MHRRRRYNDDTRRPGWLYHVLRPGAILCSLLLVVVAGAATTAAASAANSDDDGNDTTESEATPSNAAGRLGLSVSVWDGIGPVVGIWFIAAALGAAIVFPL